MVAKKGGKTAADFSIAAGNSITQAGMRPNQLSATGHSKKTLSIWSTPITVTEAHVYLSATWDDRGIARRHSDARRCEWKSASCEPSVGLAMARSIVRISETGFEIAWLAACSPICSSIESSIFSASSWVRRISLSWVVCPSAIRYPSAPLVNVHSWANAQAAPVACK